MNIYEKQMNALRQQFKQERISIQRDANRTIGHLNTAIGQVTTAEARQALRDEKARVYEMTRQSMRYNRLCYMQQLELIQQEQAVYLQQHPSKTRLRRAMALLKNAADTAGQTSLTLTFGDRQRATVTFND